MKVRCYFKDPDTMPDAVDDAVHKSQQPSGISENEWKALKNLRQCEIQSEVSPRCSRRRWHDPPQDRR